MKVCYSEEVKQNCKTRLDQAMSRLQAAQKTLQSTLEQELNRTQYEYFNKKTCVVMDYLEQCAKAVNSGQTELPMEAFAKACELHEAVMTEIKAWCEDLRTDIRDKQCSFDVQVLKTIPTTSTDIKETDFDSVVEAFQVYAKELQELATQWEAQWRNETDNALTQHFGTYMSKTCFLPQEKAAKNGCAFVVKCRDYFVQKMHEVDTSSQEAVGNAGTAAERTVMGDVGTRDGISSSSAGNNAASATAGSNAGTTSGGQTTTGPARPTGRGQDHSISPNTAQRLVRTAARNANQDASPTGGQLDQSLSSTAGVNESSQANSRGSENANQPQEPDYPSIGLNWASIDNHAKKIKGTQDLEERFGCFFEIFKEVYKQTTPFTVKLSNASEANSPEMGRLLDATRYALTSIGDPFIRLNKGSRSSWWGNSRKDAVLKGARRINALTAYFTAEDGAEQVSEASDASNDELECAENVIEAGKYRPAEIVAAIKSYSSGKTIEEILRIGRKSPEAYEEWATYPKYEHLIGYIEKKETVGMGLHIVSFILHNNVRYIQYGAHTSSLRNVKAYVGKGNEASQHIAFQYAPAMAALSRFANIILGETDNSEADYFENSFHDVTELTTPKLQATLLNNATLNKQNMEQLMKLDPERSSESDDIAVVATDILRIINKYRFALKNEQTRDEQWLDQFDMGVDMAVDAVNSLTTISRAGSKLLSGGGVILEVALGPMETLVSVTEHILKGEVINIASDIANVVSGLNSAGNKLLQTIQSLLEIYEWGQTGKTVGTTVLNATQMVALATTQEKLVEVCEEIQGLLETAEEFIQKKRANWFYAQKEKARKARMDEIQQELGENPQNSIWNDAIRVAFIDLSAIKTPKQEKDKFFPEELCYIPKRHWWAFDQIAAAYLASLRWRKEHPNNPEWAQEKKAEEALRSLMGTEKGQTCPPCNALNIVFKKI